MEEDIKVLEEMKNRKIYFHSSYFISGYVELGKDEKQAIENLISRNKELEEIKQQKLDKYLYKNQWICKDLAENYIHKSKIREKIEEYEKDVKDFEEYWSKDPRRFKRQQSIDYYKLEALKELLEEGDDK